jgi:hypothetical protein
MTTSSELGEPIGLIVAAVSEALGSAYAHGAAVHGLLRALGHIPQVAESIERELLRADALLNAENINLGVEKQFDLEVALLRATLRDAREQPLSLEKGG